MNFEDVDTNGRLLTMLYERLQAEPVEPNPEVHLGHHYLTVAREYDDWHNQVYALRLLIGTRLVDAALDELEARRA